MLWAALWAVLWAVLWTAALLPAGCAQVEPPGGGPEDRTLPKVAGMHPDSGAVGVSPDTISILFTKPMDRGSVRDWTFISPPVPIREMDWPTKSRLDLVLDRRPDSSRTYSILMGSEVMDRRKNPLGPWSAAFSTGPVLDTGEVDGKVVGRKLKVGGAFLYVWPWSDTTATSQREPPPPWRLTQAGKDGAFRVQWLPRNEPLRVCAFYDAANDRVYDREDDAWGCLDEPVVLADTSGPRTGVEIYLVLADEPGVLKGTAVDSTCIGAGEPRIAGLGREADSLKALLGIRVAPKTGSLADSLLGFAPPPRKVQEGVDSLLVRRRLVQIDSLRVIARADSARCALPVIVRLFERDTSLVSEARGKGPFEFRDIPPGRYEIRGFRDLNGNGLPDPDEPSGAYPDSVALRPGRTLEGLDFPLRHAASR